jgi:hypothetical protein
MTFTTSTNASTLQFQVKISDAFQCSAIFPLSIILYLPDPVSPSEVGNSCQSLMKLGKFTEYLQCMDNAVVAQASASFALRGKRRLLANDGVAS